MSELALRRRSVIVAMFVGLICLALLPGLLAFWPYRTKLQILESPDGKHTAELVRSDSIDRNYLVYVDGTKVYVSPDFSPRRDLPFRETLLWDRTGEVLILEVAKHRIFGFDARSRRRLSDEELLAVENQPDLPLWEYWFESEWPGIGRAVRPSNPAK